MNFIFPFSWECHHPNWRAHSIIFQRDSSTINQWSIEFLWVNIDLPGFTHIYRCLLVIIGPSNYTYFITIDSSCLKKKTNLGFVESMISLDLPVGNPRFWGTFFWEIWCMMTNMIYVLYNKYIWWYMIIYVWEIFTLSKSQKVTVQKPSTVKFFVQLLGDLTIDDGFFSRILSTPLDLAGE